MIFVTIGTQKFKFNRLIKYIENANLKDVVIQNGYTKVKNKSIKSLGVITKEEMNNYMEKADFIISHGGITVIEALEKNKKVLCVPRIGKEATREHQLEMCSYLEKEGYLLKATTEEEFKEKVDKIKTMKFKKYKANNKQFFKSLSKIVEDMLKEIN